MDSIKMYFKNFNPQLHCLRTNRQKKGRDIYVLLHCYKCPLQFSRGPGQLIPNHFLHLQKSCEEIEISNNDELWLDVEKGMRSLKQLIQNENLGDGVNTKVDRLMNDIHRLRTSAKIAKKSCQESITRFFDNN